MGGSTLFTLGRDINDNGLVINPSELPGSSNATIDVQVSDGFNTASSKAGPFTVLPKPPVVTIISPSNNSHIFANMSSTLEGTGYDRQEALTDKQFVWSSNIDGVLGIGQSVLIQNLTIGQHEIALKATDSSGLVAQDSMRLEFITLEDLSARSKRAIWILRLLLTRLTFAVLLIEFHDSAA